MISPRHPAAHLPPQLPFNLDDDQQEPRVLVLRQRLGQVGAHGDVGAVQKRGPDGVVVVVLVARWESAGDGDALVLVLGVGVEPVVVDADAVVGVAGGDGDLELGGEEVGLGEVELDDLGVLEVEPGLGGPEDEVDD